MNKDLVVDTRESWREWIKRQAEFKDPPLVPRESLPEEYHPHRSFYGKLSNTLNGIDPTPPERKSTVAREMVDLEARRQEPGEVETSVVEERLKYKDSQIKPLNESIQGGEEQKEEDYQEVVLEQIGQNGAEESKEQLPKSNSQMPEIY